MLYMPLQTTKYANVGLLNTSDVQNALSENDFRKLLTTHPKALLRELTPILFDIQIAKDSIFQSKNKFH